jgi:8-oxo-dGTP pyrophosphatase MutT (NUDIX family)
MLRQFPLPATGGPAGPAGPTGPARLPLRPPLPVRDAATVMLVRDGARGVEVFVFRRVATMAFAAGMYVFPGGAVEPADAADLPWSGPSVEQVAAVLGEAPALARALVAAAVRETFEECGVLLAVRADGGPVDVASAGWEARRRALVDGEATLGDVLLAGGLRLSVQPLRAWAHWVTPPFESRRFAARFFVAALPAGQQARDLGGEGERARWAGAAELVELHDGGLAPMLPPTLVCVQELAAAGTVAELLATPRRVRPVSPWVEQVAGPDGVAVAMLTVDLDGVGGGEARGGTDA